MFVSYIDHFLMPKLLPHYAPLSAPVLYWLTMEVITSADFENDKTVFDRVALDTIFGSG